jgi:hypothetical protein
LLQQPELPYKRLCSLRQVIGEKKSLQSLLAMSKHGLELLSLPSSVEAEKTYRAAIQPVPHNIYIERDLLSLQWG